MTSFKKTRCSILSLYNSLPFAPTSPHPDQLSAILLVYMHIAACSILYLLTPPYHVLLFRYIRYVSQIVWEPRYLPHKKPLFLKTVTMSPVPMFNKAKYVVHCYIPLLSCCKFYEAKKCTLFCCRRIITAKNAHSRSI